MGYLRESEVRAAATRARRTAPLQKSANRILEEATTAASKRLRFDIFLSHSIRDSEIVLGAMHLLEEGGFTVYVDWVVDPSLDRDNVNGATAEKLRKRMRQSDMLVYVHSNHSQKSRWMPWELGYFDGRNGNVAVLPILPNSGNLSFVNEEYLQLYPKVDMIRLPGSKPSVFVNKSKGTEYSGGATTLARWRDAADKQRPTV